MRISLFNPWNRKIVTHLFDFVFDAGERGWVVLSGDCFIDPFGDLTHFIFFHAASCHCGGSDADS